MSYDLSRTREDVCAAAIAKGKRAVFPAANELQIDIDDADALRRFERVRETLARTVEFDVCIRASATTGHFPITLTFPARTFSPLERIAYQAAFGSDGVRELLSLMLLEAGATSPTAFFELP